MSKISIRRSGCCGLRIVNGLNNGESPKQQLIYICAKIYNEDYNAAFIMFSDNQKDGRNANALKRFIIENKLGSIKESIKDDVRIWIWQINSRSTERWFNQNND